MKCPASLRCNPCLCLLKSFLIIFPVLFSQYAFDHSKARNEGVILPKPGAVMLLVCYAMCMATFIGMQYVQTVRIRADS